jgi:hypothetical protein
MTQASAKSSGQACGRLAQRCTAFTSKEEYEAEGRLIASQVAHAEKTVALYIEGWSGAWSVREKQGEV